MKKVSKSKTKTAATPQVDPYLEGLMAKLLDRLTGLERKLDTVIAQTAAKPSGSANGGAPRPPQNQGQNQDRNLNQQRPNAPRPPQENQNQQPRRDRTMYEAICAECQKVCEVPFRPAEGRAVYCKECFGKRKGGQGVRPNDVAAAFAPGAQKSAPKPSAPAAPAPKAAEAPKPAKKSRPAKKGKKK